MQEYQVCVAKRFGNILNRRFTSHYYIWFQHGERDSRNEASSSHFEDGGSWEEPSHLHSESSYPRRITVYHDRMHDMVTYGFRETTSVVPAKKKTKRKRNLTWMQKFCMKC